MALTMQPAKSASCFVTGPGGLFQSHFDTGILNISMIPSATYSFVCQATGAPDLPTDIFVSTTQGTYQARIQHAGFILDASHSRMLRAESSSSSAASISAITQTVNELAARLAQVEDELNVAKTKVASTTLDPGTYMPCDVETKICKPPAGMRFSPHAAGKWMLDDGTRDTLDFKFNGATTHKLSTNGSIWSPVYAGGKWLVEHLKNVVEPSIPTPEELEQRLSVGLLKCASGTCSMPPGNNVLHLGNNITLTTSRDAKFYIESNRSPIFTVQADGNIIYHFGEWNRHFNDILLPLRNVAIVGTCEQSSKGRTIQC